MPGTYYKTCPHCGAALDPGERCDCQNDNALTEDDLISYSEWMENNKGDWAQILSTSRLMASLDAQERYLVFRTAAHLLHFGMTDEERALTTIEQNEGVITA